MQTGSLWLGHHVLQRQDLNEGGKNKQKKEKREVLKSYILFLTYTEIIS